MFFCRSPTKCSFWFFLIWSIFSSIVLELSQLVRFIGSFVSSSYFFTGFDTSIEYRVSLYSLIGFSCLGVSFCFLSSSVFAFAKLGSVFVCFFSSDRLKIFHCGKENPQMVFMSKLSCRLLIRFSPLESKSIYLVPNFTDVIFEE